MEDAIAGTRNMLRLGLAALTAATLAWSTSASAGFGAQGATPPPSDGEPLAPLLGWQAARMTKGAVAFDLTVELARGGLTQNELDLITGDRTTTYVLDEQAGFRLGGRYALSNRVELAASVPVWVTNRNFGGPNQRAAFGDISLYAPTLVAGTERSDLSVVPWVTLPTGPSVRYLGDGGVSAGAQVIAGTRVSRFGVDGWLGMDWRTFEPELNVRPGPGMLAGVSVGYLITNGWAVHLESRGQSRLRRGQSNLSIDPDAFSAYGASSELALTSRGRFKNGWWLSGGASSALQMGPGAAEVRLFAGAGRTFGGEQIELTPNLAAATRFVVRNPNGDAIVGATLSARGESVGTSDATGTIAASRKRWKEADGLVVRAPGYQERAIDPPEAGAEVDVQLDWVPVNVTVRVVDEQGTALSAQVTTTPGDEARETQGGEAGFELQPGTWTVRATSDGFGAQSRTLALQPQGERAETVEFILLPQMGDGTLDISLADVAGDPVQGAAVSLGGRPIGASASGGTLHIEGLSPAPVTIDAVADTFRDYSRPEVSPPDEVDLVLTRQRGAVQVIVRGPDGGVINNASTRFVGPNRLGPFTLGEAGRRVFVLRPGTWQVLVSSPDHGLQQRAISIKDRDTELIIVEVVLQAPEDGESDFTVRVVDHDNNPVDGATITLDEVDYGTTSTGGELSVDGLQTGPRTLNVGGELHEPVQREVFLHDGMQEATVVLPWVEGATKVSARSPQGMVDDGKVRFDGPTRMSPVSLGESGVTYLQLDAGLWQALVSSPSWGAQQQGVAIPENSRSLHVVDALLNPGEAGVGRLTVLVVDPSGEPVSGAEIALDGAALGSTATSGTVSLMELQTGKRALDVTAPPYAPVHVDVQVQSQPSTERVQLDWGVGALLVHTKANGEPVRDAVIRMGGPRFVPATPVNSDGQRLFGVEPATWQVLVSSPSYGISQQMVVIDDTPGLKELTVDLTPADDGVAEVLYRVQDPDGGPIAGAKVTVDNSPAVVAGQGGLALVNDAEPGQHTVSVEALNFEPLVVKDVRLVEGTQERILPMQWVPRQLTVRVLGPEGKPVDATVALDGPAGAPAENTGSDGEVTLRLRPGTWQVLASTAQLGAQRAEVVLATADAPRTITLQLKKAQVEVGGGAVVIKDRVYFDTGKSTLKPTSTPILDEVAATLLAHPEIVRLEVQGHTDPVGGVELNMRLSRERATAVVSALIERGVPPEKLRPSGHGPTRPVADNDTDEGRAKNRRVEFLTEVREE